MPVLLVDEDLPRSTTSLLKKLNIESVDVRDCGLRGKSDEEIFKYAVEHKAVILTADRGFGNVHRFSLGSHSGIIILRISNEISSLDFETFVTQNLNELDMEKIAGCVAIVEDDKIRIRR